MHKRCFVDTPVVGSSVITHAAKFSYLCLVPSSGRTKTRWRCWTLQIQVESSPISVCLLAVLDRLITTHDIHQQPDFVAMPTWTRGPHKKANNFSSVSLKCPLWCLYNTLQPPQMGSMAMMNPPTMMYTQPVMRPPNPFGSVSSAQVGARQCDYSAEQTHSEVSICLHSYQVEYIGVSIVLWRVP